MKVLITGSSGMLGQALCQKLLEQEHEVIGIDIRRPQITDYRPQTFYEVDLSDKKLIIVKITEISPELIIHCAANTDVDGCELNPEKARKQNVAMTENVAKGCKITSAYMVYISTDFVFDGEGKFPYKESDKTNPINIYGKSKLEGEEVVSNILDKYLIIRTSWLFGKGGKDFVDKIIGQKKQIKVVSDQAGCPTYADDLAKAITELITQYAIRNTQYKILNITNSGSCSWLKFAKEITAGAGLKDIEILPITTKELNRPAKRPKMSVLDNAEFEKLYGKKMPDWHDALGRYLKERNSQ